MKAKNLLECKARNDTNRRACEQLPQRADRFAGVDVETACQPSEQTGIYE